MVDPRALDTLAWFDAREADVLAHPGMAFAEREILRMLVDGTAPGSDDIVARAYRMDAERRLFQTGNRAEARAFAHIALFASSFGQIRLTPPAGTGEAIDQALIASADDTDTLGELLMAAHIYEHASPAVTAAREIFDEAWAQHPRDDFAQHYHVILVGGLLYAMAG